MPMSSRKRRAEDSAVIPSSDGPEMMETTTKSLLQFKQQLSWRAGKAIPVAELLRRLEALHNELVGLDQDDVTRDSLLPVAKELAGHGLLQHKDRAVRALTACCVVDMFRLCAPHAPYTASQLKDIFSLFVSTVFPSLADPSSPYNRQHLYVLKSLAEFKSISLLSDLPSSTALVQTLFTTCFDVLSGPSKASSGEELSKNVEHHMTAVLVTLVDELPSLPDEVVDVILAQFLRADPRAATSNGHGASSKGKKGAHHHHHPPPPPPPPLAHPPIDDKQSTLLLKEAPPAYNMAKNICNSCPEKMARYVMRYFSAVIVDASMAFSNQSSSKKSSNRRSSIDLEDDDMSSKGQPSDEDFEESRKAHRLLRELWRSTPLVLQDIIPQLENELSAENTHIRLVAVETVGDMISGIGAAGPPSPPLLNPAAYPSRSLSPPSLEKVDSFNFLTTPSSPVAFASRYQGTYQAFVSRHIDKSPDIRAAWATAVGRVLMTSAGGVGLEPDEQRRLLRFFADSLVDADERVRHSAIKAIERFSFDSVISILGNVGGIAEPGSILANLADRVKDRKPAVRTDSVLLLAKLWGVASGAIAEGNDGVKELVGLIPSRIWETCYVNDKDINKIVDRALFESIVPLSYPPVKPRPQQSSANGSSQRHAKDTQPLIESEADVDKIRVERILLVVDSLEPRSRTAFLVRQAQQNSNSKYMLAFLQKCEDYNGGVIDSSSGIDEKETKAQLGRLIDGFASTLPEQQRAHDDLWKFAKLHDRRNYQLIRFCCASDSDWAKVRKAIKELSKRIEDSPSAGSSLLDTLLTLVYRSSMLVYNRSHIPAIIQYSRTDEKHLGNAAHEVLKEISKHKSEVFKSHVQDLCKALETDAPTASKPSRPGAVDDLKACADFSQKFPDDIPQERKFFQGLMSFVKYGEPRAAKYAVVIILTSANKKGMYARDIFSACTKGFKYGDRGFLSRLAALSQLMLLGANYIEPQEADAVVDIAINQVLTNPKSTPTPKSKAKDQEDEWGEEPDESSNAKAWALKILVNRLRAYPADEDISEPSAPVYQFLNQLIQKRGQLGSKNPAPPSHASRLRLLAGQLLLKLSREKRFNERLTPQAFNHLCLLVQDPLPQVRDRFVNKLMKYLGQEKISSRFYTPLFLLAYEPVPKLKTQTETWLRSRARAASTKKEKTMELLIARLISLLAHHPDFEAEGDGLKEMAQYFVLFLRTVATADNLSLIFHVAQRVKTVIDSIDRARSANLYVLSDLAQATVRRWAEAQGWSLQAWPGKVHLPGSIFAPLEGHARALAVASKMFVPEDVVDALDVIVSEGLKGRKRRGGGDHADGKERKKTKRNIAVVVAVAAAAATSSPTRAALSSRPSSSAGIATTVAPKKKHQKEKVVVTPKKRKSSDSVPVSERRRSGRAGSSVVKNYKEKSEDEDNDVDVDVDIDVDDTGGRTNGKSIYDMDDD